MDAISFRESNGKSYDLYVKEDEYSILKLEKALNTMGDPCRTLLERFYYENMSIKSIVETTHFSDTNTVKSKLYKCREMLRKIARTIKLKPLLIDEQ